MFDGFSIWHLLILFLIIILVFGSKKLVSLGPDLGKALRGFKQAMRGEEASSGKSAKAQGRGGEEAAGKNDGTDELRHAERKTDTGS